MDCPTCGLVNPPEAARCDCGFDFAAGKPADIPGWPISLTWGQRIAAFWTIFWPAWIGTFLLAIFHTGPSVPALAIYVNLLYFAIQALTTRLLVRKNYRSFRIYVVRNDGTIGRTLTMREAAAVWLWIFWPQLILVLSSSLIVFLCGTKLPAQLLRSLSSWLLLVRVLIAGPLGVGLAVGVEYTGFRLQAYALRRP
jgi:hypothetical protein